MHIKLPTGGSGANLHAGSEPASHAGGRILQKNFLQIADEVTLLRIFC